MDVPPTLYVFLPVKSDLSTTNSMRHLDPTNSMRHLKPINFTNYFMSILGGKLVNRTDYRLISDCAISTEKSPWKGSFVHVQVLVLFLYVCNTLQHIYWPQHVPKTHISTRWVHSWTVTHENHTLTAMHYDHTLTATHYNHIWYGIDRSQWAFHRMCTYIHCNTLQHMYWLQHTMTPKHTYWYYNTHIDCNTLQHIYSLQHTTAHTLTATYYNTLCVIVCVSVLRSVAIIVCVQCCNWLQHCATQTWDSGATHILIL